MFIIISTYAQITTVNVYYITPTCFGVKYTIFMEFTSCVSWSYELLNDKIQYSNVLLW